MPAAGTVQLVSATPIERVRVLTGSRSSVQLIPYDQAYEQGFEDMPRRVPDISRVRDLIGFTPRISLDDIICRVIEYVRQH